MTSQEATLPSNLLEYAAIVHWDAVTEDNS